MTLKVLALILLGVLALVPSDAVAQCPTGYPFADNCPLPAAGLNASLASRAQHVVSNATLLNTSTLDAPNGLWRDDYAVGFGASPLFYQPSNLACSLNAGNGDNGSQVKSADGKCWIANFPSALDIRWWGLTSGPINFYVSKAGNDNSGSNFCVLSASPCLTIQQALTEALKFDVAGGNPVFNFQGTGDWAEDVFVTNSLRGAANKTAVPNIGTVWPSMLVLNGNGAANTTISGTGATCATIAASNHAIIGVENLTLTSSKTACADTLFAQLGGGINVFGGNIFGASGASGCKMHAENSAYGIQIWENYTITGNGNCVYSAGGGPATIIIGAGVGTITGNPTIGSVVNLSSGGVFQTNIANPWGAVPGTMTGAGFLVSPGGVIESQGNAIAWPGNGTSYLQGGAYDQPPAPTPSSDANIGTTGTVAMLAGSTPYQGSVVMTAGGTAIGSAGNVTVTFPSPISVRRQNGGTMQCGAGLLTSGSGAWANGARVSGTNVSAGAVSFNWNNFGVGLAAGSSYTFWYNCTP